MKLRKILAGLWIILLLLAGTCYAENTENPIVARTEYGYLRLNIPSVKKIEYYGRSYIECTYTGHNEFYIYGVPVVKEYGTYNRWFDPSKDEMLDFGTRHYDASKDYIYLDKKDISGHDLTIYQFILTNFPRLRDEVKSDNQKADTKYGSYIEKAFEAHENKDWEKEYTYLKNAYDNGCQSQAILHDLAEACWNLGDYDTAIEWAGKRIEMNPSGDAYNTRAWWYYLLGQNDKALEDAEWAVFKDKNYAYILDTRGSIYYELGQYDKAIKDFDTAIKLNDKLSHAYYYRGKSYDAVGKKGDAQSDFKKAKKYDPEITDDKADFAKQRSQNQALKQQRQYQKREKYKEDLKKLNDAVYVHNNAQNFPAKVVFENDDIIITVAGNIKNNESEQFYQEVIPQEVRTNYESGVYQQQYEQLKAQVEAEQAAQLEQQRAAAKANGIKNEGIPLYRAADVQAYNNEYKNLNPAKFNYDLSKNIYVHLLKRPILLRYVTQPFVTTHNEFDFIEAAAGYFENVSDKAISLYLVRVAFDGEKYETLNLEMDKTTAKFLEWYRKIEQGEIDAKGILLDKGYFEVTLMPHDRLPFIIKFYNSDFPNGKWTSDMEKKTIDVHCEAMVGGYIFYTNENPESTFSDLTESTLLWGAYDKSSYEEVLKIVDAAFANE